MGWGSAPLRSGSLRRRLPGCKRPLIEDLAGAGLAGAAAGRDTGAVLELLEGLGTLADGLVEPLFGDAVADADVHDCEPPDGILGRTILKCK